MNRELYQSSAALHMLKETIGKLCNSRYQSMTDSRSFQKLQVENEKDQLFFGRQLCLLCLGQDCGVM